MAVEAEMIILAHLGLTIGGQETAIEAWAAAVVGVLLLIIAIFFYFLAKREHLYRW